MYIPPYTLNNIHNIYASYNVNAMQIVVLLYYLQNVDQKKLVHIQYGLNFLLNYLHPAVDLTHRCGSVGMMGCLCIFFSERSMHLFCQVSRSIFFEIVEFWKFLYFWAMSLLSNELFSGIFS